MKQKKLSLWLNCNEWFSTTFLDIIMHSFGCFDRTISEYSNQFNATAKMQFSFSSKFLHSVNNNFYCTNWVSKKAWWNTRSPFKIIYAVHSILGVESICYWLKADLFFHFSAIKKSCANFCKCNYHQILLNCSDECGLFEQVCTLIMHFRANWHRPSKMHPEVL